MIEFYTKFRLSTYVFIHIAVWMFLLLLLGGFGLYSTISIKKHYEFLINSYEKYYIHAESIRINLIVLSNLLEKHITTDDINLKNRYEKEIEKVSNKIDEEFQILQKNIKIEAKYNDKIQRLFPMRKRLQNQIIDLSLKSREKQEITKFMDKELNVFKQLDEIVVMLLKESDDEYEVKYRLIKSRYVKMLIVFIIVFMIMIYINLSGTFSIYKGILDPIKNIVAIAQEVKTGNYKSRVPSFDAKQNIKEITRLAEIMNLMLNEIEKDEQKLQEIIKDLSKTNEKLKLRNTEMEEFVRIITHDLKAPLTTIEMFSEVLERDVVKNPKRALNEIERMRLSAKKLRNLIDDLSEFSLVGIVKEKKGSMDTRKIILEVLEFFGFVNINEENIKFEIFYSEKDKAKVYLQNEIPKIYGDKSRLSQIFLNIIGNALKYRGIDCPEIYIEACTEDDFIHISIRDNGMGISPEFQDKIFDICFRLVSYDKVEGTGVGLSIVKRIINKYSGKIWVESDGEGKGSTFHIVLPTNEKPDMC